MITFSNNTFKAMQWLVLVEMRDVGGISIPNMHGDSGPGKKVETITIKHLSATGGGQGILFLGFLPIYIMFVSLSMTATEKKQQKKNDFSVHFGQAVSCFTASVYGQLQVYI